MLDNSLKDTVLWTHNAVVSVDPSVEMVSCLRSTPSLGVFLAWRVGTLRFNILSVLSFWLLTLVFSSLNLQLSASLGVFFWKPLFVVTVWTGARH